MISVVPDARAWTDALGDVCRRFPELTAVYESRRGRLALLLDTPFEPAAGERARWVRDTRRAARAITAAFRAAGCDAKVVVLQWCPPSDAATITRRWRCRYDGDPVRRARLTAQAEAAAAPDGAPVTAAGDDPDAGYDAGVVYLAPARTPTGGRRAGPAADLEETVTTWYGEMAPCWLGVEPAERRRLVLRTHRWIVERVLLRTSAGLPAAAEDLEPGGQLGRLLLAAVPGDDLDRWLEWIRVVVGDLARALARPAERRDAAWIRWLFLIPYRTPLRASGAERPPALG